MPKYRQQTDIEAAALKNPHPYGTETNTDRGSRLKINLSQMSHDNVITYRVRRTDDARQGAFVLFMFFNPLLGIGAPKGCPDLKSPRGFIKWLRP